MSSGTLVFFLLSLSLASGARIKRQQRREVEDASGVTEAMGKQFFQTVDKDGSGQLYFKEWYAWFKSHNLVSDDLHAMLKSTYHEMNVQGSYVEEADFIAWFMAPHATQAPLTNGDVFFAHKEVAAAFFNDYGQNGLIDKMFKGKDFINFIKFFSYLREVKALNEALGLVDSMVTDEDLNKWRLWWAEIDSPPKGPRGKIDREQATEGFKMIEADMNPESEESDEQPAGNDDEPEEDATDAEPEGAGNDDEPEDLPEDDDAEPEEDE